MRLLGELINIIWPWFISINILLILNYVSFKRKIDGNTSNNYDLEGMSIGLVSAMIIGNIYKINTGLAISCGLIIGLIIGLLIERK